MKEVIVEKEHRYGGKLRKPGDRYEAQKSHMQLGKALGWFREAPKVQTPAPLKAAVIDSSPVQSVATTKPARKTAGPRTASYGTRAMSVKPEADASAWPVQPTPTDEAE